MRKFFYNFIKITYGSIQKYIFQLFPKSKIYDRLIIIPLQKFARLSEAHYWKSWIKSNAFGDSISFRMQIYYSKEFPEYLRQLIKTENEKLYILDVGSGPISVLGDKWEGRKVILFPVDPLANEYNNSLSKFGITPNVKTNFAEAENLSEKFSDNLFDLVFASNSIDHCINPLQAIEQMLKVVKSECYIYLKHFINEADNEGYSGMHTWNFNYNKSDFIISNVRIRYNITEIFKNQAEITLSIEGDNILNVIIKKL